MARCKSWRPKRHAKHPVPTKPGECRGCWTVCRSRIEPGTVRCDICLEALITHPDPEVRRALVVEEGTDLNTLIRLASDDEYSVALAAEGALEELDNQTVQTPDPGYDPWADR
ncbi:hypothetical protein [Agromyces humi]|uniref:hypothetical protein n=1 Tax=Agromyces humi TaxID=1766800 RepID=UPI00135CACDD|nr:hypothetical protein [Agromyces humi]